MRNILRYSIFFIIIIPFFFVIYFLLDPDYGWHYRMGEYILNNGIPKNDPFSYTMPSYPFIDHEWLTNVFIFLIHERFGRLFLVMLWCLFVIGALIVSIGRKWRIWTYPLLILSSSILINFSGIRIQVMSWLLFSLLFYLFRNKDVFEKWKFIIPIFIILWVNLHGSFAFALLSVFIFLLLKTIEDKKIALQNIVLLITSVLATFVNPYGVRIWKEIIDQITDTNPRWFINEWYPGLGIPDISLWTFVVLSTLVVIKYRKHFSVSVIGIFVVTLIMGATSIRHFPLWILIALPLTNTAFEYLYLDLKKIKNAQEKFNKAVVIFLIITLIIFSMQSITKSKEAYVRSEEEFYPQQAVQYLQQNPSNGEIFSLNEWGGYLDWRLPTKKVFTDGRMPSWKWDAPQGEADSAFYEYIALLQNKISFSEIKKKYGIDTVLILNPDKQKSQMEDIYTHIRWKIDKKKPGSPLYGEIKKAGMKEVYRDKTSIIYR